MAKKKKAPTATLREGLPTADIRHAAKTRHLPPAGLAAQGKIEQPQKVHYAYNPHLPPVLRFDVSGTCDRLPELLEKARKSPLTDEEAKVLADALQVREPWLEWAGKRELPGFAVDPVALNIHERISTQAILKVAARQDVVRDLFADPELEYREAVQFYKYDVDWANRMILGDSLQVMASLARRENIAGKVQMIYLDPPYGINFKRNFQSEIGKREVKDKDSDLTREPETVKAYRDTWTLGVHSYLTYLRDRFVVARDLLADEGSIFVQIGTENLHRVQSVLDEVFGVENFVVTIVVQKKGSQKGELVQPINDYILWYAKEKFGKAGLLRVKFRALYEKKTASEDVDSDYDLVELPSGEEQPYREDAANALPFSANPLTSGGIRKNQSLPFEFAGRRFDPGENACWKTTVQTDDGTVPGMPRLAASNRLWIGKKQIRFKAYQADFGVQRLTNFWTGIGGAKDPIYVVQTNTRIVERLILMTTDPGDLVLDPTCGSGTTAFVAEQWGRRWITIDSSRVALALARQRLMTAKFDYYKLRSLNEEDVQRNPEGTWLRDPQKLIDGPVSFECKTVPHVTLKSIAQNVALDPIFANHHSILDEKLKVLNAALGKVGMDLRQKLAAKLVQKQKREGRNAVTEADRRRWLLPPANRDPKVELTVDREFHGWYEWEVPFDTAPDWPKALQEAVTGYRAAWRKKMDEVNAAIAVNADNEELVDQPSKVSGIVRVSGPFTMEAVIPVEQRLDEVEDEELETFDGAAESVNAEAFQDRIIRLLKQDGVQFPSNRKMHFERLEAAHGEYLHAEGEWMNGDGKGRKVCVSIGPEHGPVTTYQVENALRAANRKGADDLVFAGFSFDGAAQGLIQDDPNPNVRCHLAHIRPDVTMGDLLKDTAGSQLFTVFGLPRVRLEKEKSGTFVVEMQGVDIYNPVENTIQATDAGRVAAWFVDSDYDGRTFCITQAFFPDKGAWDKLARALAGHVDGDRFAALAGTTSLSFPAGKHNRVAIKAIDPRGNEAMRVLRLDGKYE